jgi:hypothetical protein
MKTRTDKAAPRDPRGGSGIVEIRPITSRCFGVRVQRRLIAKLKDVKGLTRANPKSDLFCIEVDGLDNNPENALKRFRELVAAAGVGMHFGAAASDRPGE